MEYVGCGGSAGVVGTNVFVVEFSGRYIWVVRVICACVHVSRGFLVCFGHECWGFVRAFVLPCAAVVCAIESLQLVGGVVVAAGVSCQVGLRLCMLDRLNVGVPFYGGLLQRFPYSVVRHPLALCEVVTCAGMLSAYPSMFNAVVFAFAVFTAGVACELEEDFLRGLGCGYDEYCHRVRWRWIAYLW